MRGDFAIVGGIDTVVGALVSAMVGRGETDVVGVVVFGLGRVGPATQSVTTAPIVYTEDGHPQSLKTELVMAVIETEMSIEVSCVQ